MKAELACLAQRVKREEHDQWLRDAVQGRPTSSSGMKAVMNNHVEVPVLSVSSAAVDPVNPTDKKVVGSREEEGAGKAE